MNGAAGNRNCVCPLTLAKPVSHLCKAEDVGTHLTGLLGLNEEWTFQIVPGTWLKFNKFLLLLFYYFIF